MSVLYMSLYKPGVFRESLKCWIERSSSSIEMIRGFSRNDEKNTESTREQQNCFSTYLLRPLPGKEQLVIAFKSSLFSYIFMVYPTFS